MEQKTDGTKVVIGRCETIEEYRSQYYAKHKEKIREQKKEWFQNNKERIYDKRKERVRCECGISVRYSYMGRHKKGLRHANRMDVINQC